MNLMVEPNTDCEHTMWSPVLQQAHAQQQNGRHAGEEVAMAASVPSSAARRISMLLTVGCPQRV
jgi:hypothetical protein